MVRKLLLEISNNIPKTASKYKIKYSPLAAELGLKYPEALHDKEPPSESESRSPGQFYLAA